MRADLAAMPRPIRITRRGLVAALAGAGIAPAAWASPPLVFPVRLGYARIGPDGFIYLRADEQHYWSALQTRTGGLIALLEPIQPSDMLGGSPPVDPDADWVLAARERAATRGLGHVVLYATQDGRPVARSGDFVSRAFAGLRAELGKYGRAAGEAHLLDVAGGPSIASVAWDASPRNPLNLFDNDRNPERETLAGLVDALGRRLQALARPAYEAQASIAD